MRNITSSVITELAKQLVRPFVACEIDFADQTLRVWTGYGTLSIGSDSNIIGTQESNISGTAMVYVTLNAPPPIPLATGQSYTLSGLTTATWLNGVTLTIASAMDVLANNYFRASYSHANYGLTSDTGKALLVGSSVNYLGVGNLASIAAIVETADLEANGIQLSLSGVPSDVLAESLSQCRQGMPVRLWLGFLDSSGAVIQSPINAFIGRMDTVSVDEGADTAVITMTAESRLIDLNRPRIRRYTDDDQQRTSPGDLGFQYVPMVQDWNGSWGLNDRSNGK